MVHRLITHAPASGIGSRDDDAPVAEEHTPDIRCPSPPLSRRWVLMAGLSTTALIVGRHAKVLADTLTEDLQTRFLRWSRVATGFADLDASIARECLELFVRSGTTPAELSALDPAAYRGSDLEQRLLDAWYTGVFAAGERNDGTTLMWLAAGIEPPGQCHGGPDSWATAPDLRGDGFGRTQ